MTDSTRAYPGVLTLLWELVTGRRPVERSGPLLRSFRRLPAPLREALRWVVRPRRRFLLSRLRALAGDRVMSGPFAGMQLVGLPVAQELLGTYERELHDVVHALARGPFGRVVNVGARYGYYAVGLARLMPQARVAAFEGDDEARELLAAAVTANSVTGRVEIRGFGEPSGLAVALEAQDAALVVCDIDGGEELLLDPRLVPALSRATILVECHTYGELRTEPLMTLRFLPTHDVRRIGTEARVLAQLPAGVGEPWRSRMPRTLEALMQEHRVMAQSWLLLTPRG
ncbi:MAG: class I SAM-dependent methyltransferase [Gemmatimonadaceae bacterium]